VAALGLITLPPKGQMGARLEGDSVSSHSSAMRGACFLEPHPPDTSTTASQNQYDLDDQWECFISTE